MACLRKRPKKNGFVWIIDFYDNEGKRHWLSTQISSRKIAEQMKAKIEVDLALGKLELPHHKKTVTLNQLKDAYLKFSQAAHSQGTFELNERFLRYFIEYAGDIPVTKVTRKDIEDYKILRVEQVSRTSVNMEIRHLKAAFSYATDVAHFIKENPFSKVKQYKQEGDNLPVYLKTDEIEKLLETIGDKNFKNLIIFYLNTGCRRTEALNLTWNDIDSGRRKIKVTKTKGRRDREIPINDKLFEVLMAMPQTGDRPFPYNRHYVTHKFKDFVKKACLNLNFSVHSLRHTFASHLVMNGVDLYTVKELLGHSDLRVTEQYAHLAPDYLAIGVNKLPY